MLHPIILYELAKARYLELLNAADRYRLSQRLIVKRPLHLLRFDRFFSGRKPEGKTAVSVQNR